MSDHRPAPRFWAPISVLLGGGFVVGVKFVQRERQVAACSTGGLVVPHPAGGGAGMLARFQQAGWFRHGFPLAAWYGIAASLVSLERVLDLIDRGAQAPGLAAMP